MSGVTGTFTGTPQWYSDYIKDLADRAKIQSEEAKAYQPYPGKRVAKFNPTQIEGNRQLAHAEPNRELYGLAGRNIEAATAGDVYRNITPQLKKARKSSAANIGRYMNPYQEGVVNRIAELGGRNLREQLLPAINSSFIKAGQFGGSGNQNLTQRALRDTQESILAQQNQALHQGYQGALGASEATRQRKLQGAGLAGNVQERGLARQLVGARGAQELAGAEQQAQGRFGETLGAIGHQEQQLEQEKMDQKYRDFLETRELPFQRTAQLSAMYRGLDLPTSTIQRTSIPAPPRPSSTSQFAGLAAGLLGSAGAGFAEGGPVDMSALQRGSEEAKRAARKEQMRGYADELTQSPDTERNRQLWELLQNTGFGMLASQNPNAGGAFGEAAMGGLNQLRASRAQAAANRMAGYKLHNELEQQELEPQQQLEQLMLQNAGKQQVQQLKGTQGTALAKYKNELEEMSPKNKIHKGPGGLPFTYEENPETGEMEAVPISGLPDVQEQKKEQEAAAGSLKSARKLYDDTIEAGKSAEEQLESVNRLGELLKKPGNRRSDLRQSIMNMAATVGIQIAPNASEQEIDAVSKEILARNFANLRGGGRGNQVEFEQALRATPGIYTHPESAQKILEQYNKAAKKSIMLKKRAQSLNKEYQGNFPATFDIMLEQPSPEEIDSEIKSLQSQLANYEGQALEGE